MLLIFAWLLIGSSIFMVTFYLSINSSVEEEEAPSLDGEPGVTVLMPAFNEEEHVEQAVESVLEIDYDNLDLIVVDDGSDDRTAEKARSFSDPRLKVIEHTENRGKAAALNTGLENVETEYSVVVDADSCIDDQIMEKSMARIDSDEELGAVIASIKPMSDNTLVRKIQNVEYEIMNFHRSLLKEIDTLDVTPGPFSIYRTSDLREVGGFDVGNPTEDLEMAWRLRKEGRSIGMVYEQRAKSEMPENFRQLYKQRVRWSRGFIHNALKHRDIFFNSNLGWFGRWQVPVNALMPVFGLLGLSLILFGVSQAFFNFVIHLSAVGLSLPNLSGIEPARFLLSQQWTIYLPLAASFVGTALIIREAFRKSDAEVKSKSGLLLYFLVFSIIKSVFWTSAYLKELLQTERIWS